MKAFLVATLLACPSAAAPAKPRAKHVPLEIGQIKTGSKLLEIQKTIELTEEMPVNQPQQPGVEIPRMFHVKAPADGFDSISFMTISGVVFKITGIYIGENSFQVYENIREKLGKPTAWGSSGDLPSGVFTENVFWDGPKGRAELWHSGGWGESKERFSRKVMIIAFDSPGI